MKLVGGLHALSPPEATVDFVPIGTVVETKAPGNKAAGLMELRLPGGAMIKLDARVDEQALVRPVRDENCGEIIGLATAVPFEESVRSRFSDAAWGSQTIALRLRRLTAESLGRRHADAGYA